MGKNNKRKFNKNIVIVKSNHFNVNGFKIFREKEYNLIKEKALLAPKDKALTIKVIKQIKRIIASSIRKLMEVSGQCKGKIVTGSDICKIFENQKRDDDFSYFLRCFFDEYNDSVFWTERKVVIFKNSDPLYTKKRINGFFKQTKKELKSLIKDKKQEYKSIRLAFLVFEIIMKVYFSYTLPKSIPSYLFEDCVNIDKSFGQYYKIIENKAEYILKKKKSICKLNKDIQWKFMLYYLRHYKIIE